MRSQTITVDSLRNLIGYEVHYEGRPCKIIEILEDDILAVILQHHEHQTTIQADQHGEAHRKVPSTVTLPVIDSDNGGFHPAFDNLNLHHLL
jgi:hypothetical protein